MNARKAIITLSVLLGLSVCGNAFLGGFVLSRGPLTAPPQFERMGGPHDEGRRGPGDSPMMRLRGVRDFLTQMPPDVRQLMGDAFKGDRENMMQGMKDIADARAATIEALKAEPFDVEKLRAALVAQRSTQSATQEHVHEMLVGVIEKLTPEQRQQLAGSAQRLFK